MKIYIYEDGSEALTEEFETDKEAIQWAAGLVEEAPYAYANTSSFLLSWDLVATDDGDDEEIAGGEVIFHPVTECSESDQHSWIDIPDSPHGNNSGGDTGTEKCEHCGHKRDWEISCYDKPSQVYYDYPTLDGHNNWTVEVV